MTTVTATVASFKEKGGSSVRFTFLCVKSPHVPGPTWKRDEQGRFGAEVPSSGCTFNLADVHKAGVRKGM